MIDIICLTLVSMRRMHAREWQTCGVAEPYIWNECRNSTAGRPTAVRYASEDLCWNPEKKRILQRILNVSHAVLLSISPRNVSISLLQVAPSLFCDSAPKPAGLVEEVQEHWRPWTSFRIFENHTRIHRRKRKLWLMASHSWRSCWNLNKC